MADQKTSKKKKVKKNIQTGVAHILSTFNNTVITITDVGGNAIAWSSGGQQGFKGSRKSTPFAAQLAAEECAKKAQEQEAEAKEAVEEGEANAGPTDENGEMDAEAEADAGTEETGREAGKAKVHG